MKISIVIFADFLLTNLWWITALCVLFIIAAYFLIDFLIDRKKNGKKKAPRVNRSLYLEALGGEGNLIDKRLEGSRIIIHLHDYSSINRDKLRDAGVSGCIVKTDQLTLVIKENTLEVYNKIFPNS